MDTLEYNKNSFWKIYKLFFQCFPLSSILLLIKIYHTYFKYNEIFFCYKSFNNWEWVKVKNVIETESRKAHSLGKKNKATKDFFLLQNHISQHQKVQTFNYKMNKFQIECTWWQYLIILHCVLEICWE